MAINNKKSAIPLNVETPLPESLQDIPRMDETTYRYLCFEMREGDVKGKEMMETLEERIKEKPGERSKMVETFETRNRIQFINQNAMSVAASTADPSSSPSGYLTESTR